MLLFSIVIVCFIVLLRAQNDNNDCKSFGSTQLISMVLCSVENHQLQINKESISNSTCYIGKDRCKQILFPPLPSSVLPSKPPPSARNKKYQELATIAESSVPDTWWRKGFADDRLLLSHNNKELPTKLFDSNSHSNKKLKNLYQCATRQHFMRKSLNFEEISHSTNCSLMNEPFIQLFHSKWKSFSRVQYDRLRFNVGATELHKIILEDGLLPAALRVLEYFYHNFGGIWTGCFGIELLADCRGALAAASLVASLDVMIRITTDKFSDGDLTKGYILSSLGRSLLHGDSSTTGNLPITVWKLQMNDFIALQSAFLKLYIDSVGELYSEQLNKYIPFAFPPGFSAQGKMKWKRFSNLIEPVYTSLRNWMFTECSNLIDFGPYRPLVAFLDVRKELLAKPTTKRTLVDIGANGFFASPKYLIDSYSVYLPFTHVVMVEPEPHFSATIPQVYSDRYNISVLPIYVEVGTKSETDMLVLLPKLVSADDYVVLKFDVDPNRFAYGPTMEWGFLFEITRRPDIASLIDEIYIELHFNFPALYWQHYHSNWEALDVFRYLRNEGIIVHSWP